MSCTITDRAIRDIAESLGVSEDFVQNKVNILKELPEDKLTEFKVTPSKSLARLLNEYKVTLNDKPITIMDFEGNTAIYQDKEELKSIPVSKLVGPNGINLTDSFVAELKSDMEFVLSDLDGFETYIENLMNNPEKFRELASSIEEMDSIKLDSDYRNMLYNSLNIIIDPIKKLLPAINVHINKAFSMTGGVIKMDGAVKDLYLGIGPASNRSALEIYVHELYHAATHFLVTQKDPYTAEVKARMEHIMSKFIENTTVDKLAKHMDDPVTAKQDAENILNYIAEHGLVEFIPHAMSNKAVMARLQEMNTPSIESEKSSGFTYDIIMWIRKAFNRILQRINKEPKGNDLIKMVYFVDRLTRANSNRVWDRRTHKIKKLFNLFDRADKFLADKIKYGKSYMKDHPSELPNPADSTWKQYLKAGKIFGRAIFDSSSRDNATFLLSAYGAKPEGTLQHLTRDITKASGFAKLIDNIGLRVQDIDRKRETGRHSVINNILEGFNRKLNTLELGAIKALVDSDARVLQDKLDVYTSKIGDVELQADINALLNKLETQYGTETKNYYEAQARVLARYMMTGKGDITLLKNAYNIANKINDKSVPQQWASQETIDDIDRLTSLIAFNDLPTSYKETLHNLLIDGDKDNNGLGNLIMHLDAIHEESKELFDNNGEQHLAVKGYSKDLYPRNSESIVAPIADKAKMEGDGYKLVSVLKPHPLHGRTIEMGFYVSRFNLKPRLERGAMRLQNNTHRGMSITESYGLEIDDWEDKYQKSVAKIAAERDINKLRTEMAKKIAERKQGNFKFDSPDTVIIHPMVNTKGEITNFNYEMSKADKINLLGASTNPIELIANTRASIIDKKLTPVLNKELIEVIQRNAEANTPNKANLGRDMQLYAFIGPDANKKEYRELWGMLPREVRYKLDKENPAIRDANGNWSRSKPLGFYIRRDMINQIMGQQEIQWARSKFAKNLPPNVKLALRVAEKVWESVIGHLKEFIIIKMPVVLIQNIISNILLSTITRSNPITVVKLQLEGVRELNRYLNIYKKLFNLETKQKAGKITAEEIRMIEVYKNRLENSSIKELIDAGFYTQIIEEAEIGEESGDILSDIYHKQMEKLPKMIRSGVSLVMLDKNSPYYKFVYQATQFSDFAARYAQHHLNIKKGMSTTDSINMVKDAFINYNRLDSKLISKLNRMGLAMFTKYYTRIHRYVAGSIAENPLKVIAGVLTLNMLWPQASNPWESSIFTSGPLHVFHNPITSVWDTFNVPLVEASSEIVSYM